MLSDDGELNWQAVIERLTQWVRHRVRDAADADELVQDILERLVANEKHLVAARNPVGWMHRVATNAIIDYYRRPKRYTAQIETSLPETKADGGTSRAELSDCLRPLVMQLDVRSRDALLSTDLGNKSQTEAAQDEGISVSTLKSRIQRGRRKLRHILLQCCDVELDRRHRVIDFTPRETIAGEPGACCYTDCSPSPDSAD